MATKKKTRPAKSSSLATAAKGAKPRQASGPAHLAIAFDLFAVGVALTLLFSLFFHQYFPNDRGRVGHDYSYFLPHLLAGDFWIHRNGFFAIPWFTPAFCGGVPMFANPQSPFYMLPQWLSATLVDPLTAVYLTFLLFAWLGYAGSYLLLARSFGSSRPAALLGGVLFMWNGLYSHRMMVGHLPFHAFMLTPLLAHWLLRAPKEGVPGRRGGFVRDAALAAVALSYMVLSGMIQMVVPVALAVALIGIVHGMTHGNRARFWAKFSVSSALAGAVCLARLAASGAFLAPFPREDYKLPGADSVFGALRLLVESLFVGPAHEAAKAGLLVNQQWDLERHEFEFGITFVPALILVAGAVVGLVRARRKGFSWRPGVATALQVLAVGVILALPVALNTFSPAWNEVLKGVPLLRSSSSLIRWFCLYIPTAILAACCTFDKLWARPLSRWLAAGLGIVGCLIVNLMADDTFYVRQPYDPAPVSKAYAALSTRLPDIEAIGDARAGGNDALVRGVSPAACYEPIFGYRLEHLPWKGLKPGPVNDARDGWLNLKNPACYVFPEENHCTPGDHFGTQQKEAAAAFASYRPYAFEMSSRQRVANLVSFLSVAGLVVLLALAPLVARFRRPGTR